MAETRRSALDDMKPLLAAKVRPRLVLAFLWLWERAGRDVGEVIVEVENMAAELGVVRSTARRWLLELEAAPIAVIATRKVPGGWSVDVYQPRPGSAAEAARRRAREDARQLRLFDQADGPPTCPDPPAEEHACANRRANVRASVRADLRECANVRANLRANSRAFPAEEVDFAAGGDAAMGNPFLVCGTTSTSKRLQHQHSVVTSTSDVVVDEQIDFWETVRADAKRVWSKLFPRQHKPVAADDRELLLKCAYLVRAGFLSEDWLWDSVNATVEAGKTGKRRAGPMGYLWGCLERKCIEDQAELTAAGIPATSFRALLAAVNYIPPPRNAAISAGGEHV